MHNIPEQMHGVVLTGHGGPEMLEYRSNLPVPTLSPTDVLIRVEAAGINNTDINTREAWYSKGEQDAADATWSGQPLTFPRIQGADVCGTIVQTGNQVDASRVGDRVLVEPLLRETGGLPLEQPWYFGSECDGGFAQYVAVASRHACKIESTLSSVALASFPCAYSTAENMLTRAAVSAGDTVYVTGASGGVGSATVQLAKARGAEVIAVTTAEKAAGLQAIGADTALTRDEDPLVRIGANGVDVVIDLVAGAGWPNYLTLLKPGGRYAVAGAIAGPMVSLDVRTLYLKDLSFFGCTVLNEEVFGNLIRLIEQEKIAPVVAATYPLAQIAEAQAAFQSKAHIGKIVLEIP